MSETTWDLYRAGDVGGAVLAADAALTSIDVGRHLHFSGLAMLDMGDVQRGIVRLWAAAELYPQTTGYFRNAAIAACHCRQYEWAERFAATGLQSDATQVDLHLLRARALNGLGRLEEAGNACRRVLDADPRHVAAWNELANVLALLGSEEQAIGCYRTALEINPDDECALTNLCKSLSVLRLDAEADVMLPRLEKCRHPMSRFGLATMLLSRGNWRRGFEIYRERWAAENMAHELPRMQGLPWLRRIEDAWGQHLLVVCEQGFGDTIQFCRLVPEMLAFADSVTIEAPPELQHLLTSLDPRVRIIRHGESREGCTMLVPMLDLPAIRRIEPATACSNYSYLGVDAEVQDMVTLPYTAKPKVGLVWSGRDVANPEQAEANRRRSVDFGSVARMMREHDGVQFVALQPLGDDWAQVEGLWTPVSPGMTFACTAAIIEQLDLVIAVDTAAAHLAGAMGKPVWMLSRRDACWRWIRGREDTPWYPSMKIFNQLAPGGWGEVLERVSQCLAEWSF